MFVGVTSQLLCYSSIAWTMRLKFHVAQLVAGTTCIGQSLEHALDILALQYQYLNDRSQVRILLFECLLRLLLPLNAHV